MSASDSEDEEMRRAIALSLGQPDPVAQTAINATVDLTSESPSPPPQPGPSEAPPVPSTILHTLDRAQMEQERLARKRKAGGSPPSSPKPKAQKLESSSSSSSPAQRYLNGVVKKTYCAGFPRDGADVTLREVLQPEGLKMAILSSFMWDVGWVFSHLKWREGTKVVCVMQAKDEATKETYRQEMKQKFPAKDGGARNVRLCFPSMEGGVNCMHSKLMVLSYEGFLRLAVPTANLVPYDWGEDGGMENSVFIIDLPRLQTRTPEAELTPFGQELVYFMDAKGLDKTIITSLRNFDFTATKDLAFVHTIGGSHLGHSWQRTGYPGLSCAVQQLGLNSKQTLDVDFVTSSVGSLNMTFLSNIYRACQGEDFSKDADKKKTDKRTPWNQDVAADSLDETVNEHFRIYFPTHETVTSSIAGTAGTICIQQNYYNSPNFPRALLRDCKSVRKGVLMHNKIIFVQPSTSTSSSSPPTTASPSSSHSAWAYIGSANCSESAWGNKVVRDRATKELKLFARNWECGVIVSGGRGIGDGSEVGIANGGALKGGVTARDVGKETWAHDFKDIVPIPMVVPGEEYGERKPWYFMGNG